MRDKFRENFKIALPAAVITAILIAIISVSSAGSHGEVGNYNLVMIILYLVVLAGGS